ncbi:hypothetical protein GCM10009416_51490 [Craurococcus roseus]|uniref:Uncharacterized protein n=1 Tax=Craurococcus roseus TaxID=77585 RepID=A0ABN1GC46_9PROT
MRCQTIWQSKAAKPEQKNANPKRGMREDPSCNPTSRFCTKVRLEERRKLLAESREKRHSRRRILSTKRLAQGLDRKDARNAASS